MHTGLGENARCLSAVPQTQAGPPVARTKCSLSLHPRKQICVLSPAICHLPAASKYTHLAGVVVMWTMVMWAEATPMPGPKPEGKQLWCSGAACPLKAMLSWGYQASPHGVPTMGLCKGWDASQWLPVSPASTLGSLGVYLGFV